MNKYKINFPKIPWESKPGVKSKSAHINISGMKMRLVEFDDKLMEINWCMSGHIGYVLEGRLFVHFEKEILEFNAGEGINIPAGTAHKHKAMIRKGEKAKLILFDE